MATTTEPAPVQLRVAPLRRWGRGARLAILGGFGVAVGLVGLSEVLAPSTSVTVTGKIAFGVIGLASLLLGGWLLRTGVYLARHLASRVPVLTATATAIRLERPGRKARSVAREQVAGASFELRRDAPPGEPALAYLEWRNGEGRSLGTWTVDPVIRGGLPAFLAAIGVEPVTLSPPAS